MFTIYLCTTILICSELKESSVQLTTNFGLILSQHYTTLDEFEKRQASNFYTSLQTQPIAASPFNVYH